MDILYHKKAGGSSIPQKKDSRLILHKNKVQYNYLFAGPFLHLLDLILWCGAVATDRSLN